MVPCQELNVPLQPFAAVPCCQICVVSGADEMSSRQAPDKDEPKMRQFCRAFGGKKSALQINSTTSS